MGKFRSHPAIPRMSLIVITGHKIFGLPKEQAREPGKTGDLAFGYMGWRRRMAEAGAAGDTSTEIEIKRRQQIWRRAHPHTMRFWHDIDRAAKIAVRHPGKIVPCRRPRLPLLRDWFPAPAAAERPKDRLSVPQAEDRTTAARPSVVFMDQSERPVE